ncbi:DNA-directed RNA polymerase III subunit rpc8 [Phlyctema vagabunda]|uniref:DNA-directed RNA polymerase subunit n=1 Tax=Phlyctema vagabunda TaxID=108571 RepID=A0ABR4P312_9HELO
MFILTKIADLVQIEPNDFTKDASAAIKDNINAKYSNKVIQKIGLCVCLYDLLSASEGLIGHGTGIVNVNVEFRLIVFRPFKHEVMMGRISSADTKGINIRTTFFNDIFVPCSMLPEGASFNPTEGIYEWDQEGSPLYYDNHEMVRFRVESEEWFDQAPVGPAGDDDEESKKSPYRIIATMEDPGLGPCLWWDDAEEEGDEGDEQMEDA